MNEYMGMSLLDRAVSMGMSIDGDAPGLHHYCGISTKGMQNETVFACPGKTLL